MITFDVTDDLREQADEHGYESSEDYTRTKKERDYDGYVGDLGELVFAEILEEKTSFDYEHLGGKTEADFVVEGCEIDVKVRTVIGENKKDLIVPSDLPDGFHDFYVLLRCVYADDDWESKDRAERKIEALEFIGLWDVETVEQVSEPFKPRKVQGRDSENYRETVLCDFETRSDIMDFAPMVKSHSPAQPAD